MIGIGNNSKSGLGLPRIVQWGPAVCLMVFAMVISAAEIPPKLQDATAIPDFRIVKSGDERMFKLPQLPPKPGMITVLRCRMSSFGNGGCNNCARLNFNDTPLGMITASGRPRLLFRGLTFHLKEKVFSHIEFKFFKGSNITLPFARDCDDADGRTTDDLGSWFVFDLTDAANPVDVNTVTFRNIRVDLGGNNTLTVKDVSVGYLPVSVLPKTKMKTIQPGKSFKSFTFGGTKVELYRSGGFSVAFPGLPAYAVETGISMKLGAGFTLLASDGKPAVSVSHRQVTANCLEFTARWPSVRLDRTLTVNKDGRVDWYDKWTNTDKKQIRGIPLRYRTGLAGTETRNWLSGSYEALETIIGSNSTIFYEDMNKFGTGCTFAAEDDNSELVLDAVNNSGIVEIYSPVLTLAPGKSFKLHYSITGVPEGGYWKFINDLRRRRRIGRCGVERPFFWGAEIPVIRGLNMEQRIKKNLGGLGPITIAFAPWINLLDREALNVPRKPGMTYYEHQEQFRQDGRKKLVEKIRLYKRLLPNAKVMVINHPAMKRTYMPEFNTNPLRVSAIRNADGSPYHHEGYDSILLRKKAKEGWSIIYYLPLPGTPWYNRFMEDLDFFLNNGADGVYVDEYSFRTPRNYRRYDYSAWDGFSADLDENGKVKALKSDNTLTTMPFRSALEQRVTGVGKLLLGNGGECGRIVPSSSMHGFVEGTSMIYMPKAHLLHVPLVLGNYGTENTLPGVLKAVREALSQGCVYSPHNRTNWVLSGPDNFVCKLYPVTVTEIGPGFVAARERLIVMKTGTYSWTGVTDGEVELFVYDAKGNRIRKGARAVVAAGKIKLEVPEQGLVIAEKSSRLWQGDLSASDKVQ